MFHSSLMKLLLSSFCFLLISCNFFGGGGHGGRAFHIPIQNTAPCKDFVIIGPQPGIA